MTLTLILLAIGFTLLFLAVRSLRSNRLNERYALVFVFVGLPFFGLAAWPDGVGWFAAWLGIEYQTILLLTVTTFFLSGVRYRVATSWICLAVTARTRSSYPSM